MSATTRHPRLTSRGRTSATSGTPGDLPAPPDPWVEAGLDAGLAISCECAGWSLDQVTEVLCTDTLSPNPLDWCLSGLAPLEVFAAIDAAEPAPQPHFRRTP